MHRINLSSSTMNELQQIKSDIRFILHNSQMPIQELDYRVRSATGKSLPYLKYGHICLSSFLSSLTDTVVVRIFLNSQLLKTKVLQK